MAETERTVQDGKWGKWFPFIGEDGKEHGLKIFDWVYDKYYEPGYMTDQMLIDMVDNGMEISFEIPDGATTKTIKAKVVPHTTKMGIQTKIIQFEGSSKLSDSSIITNNLEKIATSYWSSKSGRFDYTMPQHVIDKLNLSRIWRTWATNEKINDKYYGTIKIYRANVRKSTTDSSIYCYCEVDKKTDTCIMVDEEALKKAKQDEIDKNNVLMEERKKLQDHIKSLKQPYIDFITNIENVASMTDKLTQLETITAGVNVPNLESLIAGQLSSKTAHQKALKAICYDAADEVSHIRSYNYTNDEETIEKLEKIKNKFLMNVKIYLEYKKIIGVRNDLLNQFRKDGLEKLVEGVDVDTALDIGQFREVQKILVKYKYNVEQYIISNMYKEILDPTLLKTNLLNLLKIYYDFYDMPEKDRQAIAKFIAKHRLKDYYDRISKYDDVLETLVTESRDPKLLKPILSSIAGTSRANMLKDKTFYFERRARLNDDILLYKPIELVEEMRKYIKEFNVSSNVAILINIELDADESFIFQFYTFSDEGDGSDFDGRRVKYMTKIFNMHNPTKKIGFHYE